jgi:hypothetical protein
MTQSTNHSCSHQTVGLRTWCIDCSEWCYPDPGNGCVRCRLRETETDVSEYQGVQVHGIGWVAGGEVGAPVTVQTSADPTFAVFRIRASDEWPRTGTLGVECPKPGCNWDPMNRELPGIEDGDVTLGDLMRAVNGHMNTHGGLER